METFTLVPSWSTPVDVSDRINAITFGDGYEQRASDGINTRRQKWTLNFEKITTEKAEQLIDFLNLVGALDAFIWRPPAPYDAAMFVARSPHQHTYEAHNAHNFKLIFEEDFNPGATRIAIPEIAQTPATSTTATVTVTTATALVDEFRYSYHETQYPISPTPESTLKTVGASVLPVGYYKFRGYKSGYLDSRVTAVHIIGT